MIFMWLPNVHKSICNYKVKPPRVVTFANAPNSSKLICLIFTQSSKKVQDNSNTPKDKISMLVYKSYQPFNNKACNHAFKISQTIKFYYIKSLLYVCT